MEDKKTIKVLTIWGRIKYAVISLFLLFASIAWFYTLTTEPNVYESGSDTIFSIIMAIGLGWGGLALLARVFSKNSLRDNKKFFWLKKMQSAMGGIKALLMLALLIGGACLVIAIIIGLGPLWIIVILLFLIFLVVVGR